MCIHVQCASLCVCVCVEEWFVLGVDKLKSSAERSDRDTRMGVGVVLVN